MRLKSATLWLIRFAHLGSNICFYSQQDLSKRRVISILIILVDLMNHTARLLVKLILVTYLDTDLREGSAVTNLKILVSK